MSRLAEASGIHASTISAMMYGDRRPRQESIDRIAAVLADLTPNRNKGDIRYRVHKLVGQALGDPGPFEPHPDADLLSVQERKAVNELIRLLAAQKKKGGVDAVRSDLTVVYEDEVPAAAYDEPIEAGQGHDEHA